MSTPSVSRFGLIVLAACALSSLPAVAGSQARIVRLSDVQGAVQINKNTGLGFENAFVNLPITQGTQLRTRDNGRAEIEFEDGSCMRLAPDTTVRFSTLSLNDAGARISEVNLVDGMAYINWLGKSGDQFSVNFSREKLSLERAAHFRVDTSPEVANLAVFKGDVDVEGPAGKLTVEKKKTAVFSGTDDDKYKIENKVAEAPLDSWDKDATAYHDQYAKNDRKAQSPYGYGLSDLNYYGAFTDVSGYGMMWQPFFTGVGWDPFMDGVWGFYPGFGYMFASAYPWGWLPYRYGNWMFVPAMGWMWQPGMWNSWQTMPSYRPTNLVHVNPLVAPTTGTMRTVAVGRVGATSIGSAGVSTLFVGRGSAGLGIPRGSMDNLKYLNHQVARHGFAEIRSAPPAFAASSPNRGFGPGPGRGAASGFGGSRGTMSHSSMGMGGMSAGHASGGTTGGGHR